MSAILKMPGVPGSGIPSNESDDSRIAYCSDGNLEEVDPPEPEVRWLPLRSRVARRFTSKAIRTLVRNMDDPDAAKSTAAAKAILAEGWGNPGQVIEHKASDLRNMGDEELRAMVREGLQGIADKLAGRELVIIQPAPTESEG